MNVRVNRAMLELLGGDPEFYEMSSLEPSEALDRFYEAGFDEIDKCIIPHRLNNTNEWHRLHHLLVSGKENQTGVECGISHLYVDDFAPIDTPLDELTRFACDYAWILRKQIISSSVTGTFRIIVSAQLQQSKPKNRHHCSLRYHKVRRGQPWLADSLEGYSMEGIMVMDFDIQHSTDPA